MKTREVKEILRKMASNLQDAAIRLDDDNIPDTELDTHDLCEEVLNKLEELLDDGEI